MLVFALFPAGRLDGRWRGCVDGGPSRDALPGGRSAGPGRDLTTGRTVRRADLRRERWSTWQTLYVLALAGAVVPVLRWRGARDRRPALKVWRRSRAGGHVCRRASCSGRLAGGAPARRGAVVGRRGRRSGHLRYRPLRNHTLIDRRSYTVVTAAGAATCRTLGLGTAHRWRLSLDHRVATLMVAARPAAGDRVRTVDGGSTAAVTEPAANADFWSRCARAGGAETEASCASAEDPACAAGEEPGRRRVGRPVTSGDRRRAHRAEPTARADAVAIGIRRDGHRDRRPRSSCAGPGRCSVPRPDVKRPRRAAQHRTRPARRDQQRWCRSARAARPHQLGAGNRSGRRTLDNEVTEITWLNELGSWTAATPAAAAGWPGLRGPRPAGPGAVEVRVAADRYSVNRGRGRLSVRGVTTRSNRAGVRIALSATAATDGGITGADDGGVGHSGRFRTAGWPTGTPSAGPAGRQPGGAAPRSGELPWV